MGVRIIILKREILILEVENILDLGIDYHLRQPARLTPELCAHLVEMIMIDVRVAESVYKLARLETGHLCHHHEQQRVGGNVERHPEKTVGTALIEHERETAT